MIINRVWAMPNKNTFKIKPIAALIERYAPDIVSVHSLDPFANSNKLASITNDIDPQYKTDYKDDALVFLKRWTTNTIDLVFFDPPYSITQAKRLYTDKGLAVDRTSTSKAYWSKIKKEIARILTPGGLCISCGWNSGGIGKCNGFEIIEILMVAHGGNRNDTIVTVDKKIK